MKRHGLKVLGICLMFIFTFINSVYALSPQTELNYEGIDVSDWQGYIDYEQVKNCGGHSHVSKDLKIDASTCLFPDSTWFIKGEIHVGCKYGSDYGKLISLLITSKGQDSVYDYPEYPQFLKSDIKEMTLTEITEPEKEIDLKGEIKKLIESIKNIIGSNV